MPNPTAQNPPLTARISKTDLDDRLDNSETTATLPPSHDPFFTSPRKPAETAIMAAVQGAMSKRRKFVADGVFYAELNEFFQRELAEEGYSGVEVRVTPTVTDISTSPFPMSMD